MSLWRPAWWSWPERWGTGTEWGAGPRAGDLAPVLVPRRPDVARGPGHLGALSRSPAGAGVPVSVVRPAARAGNRLMLAQCIAEAGTSSPVARAVAEPLDRCDACAYGEDARREVVQV